MQAAIGGALTTVRHFANIARPKSRGDFSLDSDFVVCQYLLGGLSVMNKGREIPWLVCGLAFAAIAPARAQVNEIVLQGTTQIGGTDGGRGTVYSISPAGVKTVLYNFTGGADGNYPIAVIHDQAGNLYGTTNEGGCCEAGGVVFTLDPAGDVGQPAAGVIGDAAGNLYGTATGGGKYNHGVIYRLGATSYKVLYSFTGRAGMPAQPEMESSTNWIRPASYFV
jgi:uncharacterized repeat protein (TIGR03803 family)